MSWSTTFYAPFFQPIRVELLT